METSGCGHAPILEKNHVQSLQWIGIILSCILIFMLDFLTNLNNSVVTIDQM